MGEEALAREASNFKGATAILAKWLWLHEHEPQLLRAARGMFLSAHHYVACALVSRGLEATLAPAAAAPAPLTLVDRTTASTTGLLAPRCDAAVAAAAAAAGACASDDASGEAAAGA
eukprot:scaffold2805_cov202-Prasinococcus_capsulatus_cf.AAC.1